MCSRALGELLERGDVRGELEEVLEQHRDDVPHVEFVVELRVGARLLDVDVQADQRRQQVRCQERVACEDGHCNRLQRTSETLYADRCAPSDLQPAPLDVGKSASEQKTSTSFARRNGFLRYAGLCSVDNVSVWIALSFKP